MCPTTAQNTKLREAQIKWLWFGSCSSETERRQLQRARKHTSIPTAAANANHYSTAYEIHWELADLPGKRRY